MAKRRNSGGGGPAGTGRGSAGALEDAVLAGSRREYGEAVRILIGILSDPDAPAEAYLFLGRSLHALKDYSRALAVFNDYIRLKPRSGQGYFFAGRSYLALGMPNRAVPILKKALDLAPKNAAFMAILGAAFLKARRSAQAAETLRQAVETAAEQNLSQAEQRRVYHAYINALFIRGIRLCRQENYELGIQMLRFVMENGPEGVRDIPLLTLEMGRACRELGLLDEALEYYTQALTRAPQDLRIRWYRASILMALGNTAGALQEIEHIRSVDAGLPDLPWNSETVDFFMIRSFLETGEWRRAADGCRDWIKARSGGGQQGGQGPDAGGAGRRNDALVHTMYAEALRNLKNYKSALNHLDRAAKMQGDETQIQYERLLVAWEGKDWKVLKSALRRLSALRGDENVIRRFTILYKINTGTDDQEVLGLLQEAVRTLGPEPEIMYALGERYLKVGLIPEALSWFRKTCRVQEDHERAYLGEIAALEVLSVPPPGAAVMAANTYHDIRAAGEQLRKIRAAEQRAAEQWKTELGSAYDRYVRRWPDNQSIRRDRALYLIHTFKYEEAVKELETLLPWEPGNPSLRRVLAYGYRKTGRYREAAVFLKSLLKEKPRDIELLLEYSGCLERAGAGVYAVAVLEKAMALFTASADIPLALGLLHYRKKGLEKAFDCLRESAARAPKDPRPWQWMAVISRNNGEEEGARRYEYEAKKRKP
ncbi:hypothetical protein AGMMS49587_03570 [Spirochaetia bacterium]|nr:hypothetical protein AGMMS49587_03570 [Spirochaetia bacterium]